MANGRTGVMAAALLVLLVAQQPLAVEVRCFASTPAVYIAPPLSNLDCADTLRDTKFPFLALIRCLCHNPEADT